MICTRGEMRIHNEHLKFLYIEKWKKDIQAVKSTLLLLLTSSKEKWSIEVSYIRHYITNSLRSIKAANEVPSKMHKF